MMRASDLSGCVDSHGQLEGGAGPHLTEHPIAVTGPATAIRRFLANGVRGPILNVSSHQARRLMPGALPYATAKAATEGPTRALAVEYGPCGIRTNAVALASIATERYESLLLERGDLRG
jgi:NAD(P)-dependent dehydrogenase (short-subunit alcohol dehydrogenase family)